jgi:tRNA pseudouridine32 synthase/23S rRNA pseudouridine746 synthase
VLDAAGSDKNGKKRGKGYSLSISTSPSIVSLPDTEKPYPTLLAFLAGRFPKIPEQTWLERIAAGKVLTEEGQPVTLTTAYMPNSRLFYFREVRQEPAIPFQERILFTNDHLMVVCKPHFLPVTPGGPYVRETLINRLQENTGNPFLSPINRIDQGTAGLVLMSVNKQTRGAYQQLFMDGLVRKTYEAIGRFPCDSGRSEWLVENRLETGEPWFRMKTCAGTINARSRIRLLEIGTAQARFQLSPLTGKKHQLRMHMSGLGFTIVNDRYYPALLPEMACDFSHPLQLLSQKIEFRDPISGQEMSFTSQRQLSLQTVSR